MTVSKDKVKLTATAIPTSEYSEEFLQGMLNRMGVSFHKYGPLAQAYPDDVDAIKSLRQRLDKYRRTGNTEYLIDAANFAMIEFMRPAHPKAHFKPTDSRESPGRTLHDGRVTRKHNLDVEVSHDNRRGVR